ELALRAAGSTAHRGPASTGQFVALEPSQNLPRAIDNRARQSGQPRHLYAVTPVRAAGDNLAEEDDVVLPFACGNVKVDHAWGRVGKVRQLVVVGRKERFRPCRRMCGEALRNCPRDAQTVEGGGPASDLVEHDETAGGRGMKDL